MKVEQKINSALKNNPKIKKTIKRTYQLLMYLMSSKEKSVGKIQRLTPNDGFEYFFGYYDKSPWDITEKYILCLRVKSTTNSTAPTEKAEIVMIDTKKENSLKVLGSTNTWNIQQGAMLQWLGPDFQTKIIYNDFREGAYVSVIYNIVTNEENILVKPIYSVAKNGEKALTLDFTRLHRLRPGYGYSNTSEIVEENKYDETCIWSLDLINNNVKDVLTYRDFIDFETTSSMSNSEHRVNHLMINDSGNRFMVLHRWSNKSQEFTRLITANIDGTEMYNLSDEGMVSHCTWKSDKEILAFAHKSIEGNGYFLMEDKSNAYEQLWEDLTIDGHPSFDPSRKWVVTDTYPNRKRMASVFLLGRKDKLYQIAQVFAPFKYDNEYRCDLHPRWNRAGTKICIDSVFEGRRAMYSIDVKNIVM